MTNVVYRTEAELWEWRERLLGETQLPYEELAARATEWALDERQLSIWRTVQAIDFLLGNEGVGRG